MCCIHCFVYQPYHFVIIQKQSSYFPAANTDLKSLSQTSVDSCKSGEANTGICQQGGNDSEVKRMIKMLEQQTSSAMQGKHPSLCLSVIIPNSLDPSRSSLQTH